MNGSKITVLVLLGYFLPGYKSGGPLRTILNVIEHLGDEVEFLIVTRDRDLGDAGPYPCVEDGKWQEVGGAKVRYLGPGKCTIGGIARLISETPHDFLYVNSFFDLDFAIKPLLVRRFASVRSTPVVVAPRGEFSSGALRIRTLRKRVYIHVTRFLGLYRNVVFQASSDFEKRDIMGALGIKVDRIRVATDLPPQKRVCSALVAEQDEVPTVAGEARVIFLSRISPMKNLDFALRVLADVGTKVTFDIWGPLEDTGYWEQCESLMRMLPNNVKVVYRGTVQPDAVRRTFSSYDLFFFPTRGENYGHVIAEALSVGTPVLTSDMTPWRELERDGVGWDLPLEAREKFVHRIEEVARMDGIAKAQWRKRVAAYAGQRLSDPRAVEANRQLFREMSARTHMQR